MASWQVCALVVCIYGFLKAMRPSEAYLTSYLTEPPINLTNSEVYNQVYPVWTYSYLVALIPVFLVTDLLRYKSVIVLEACCFIATWLMLLFGRGVLTMQFMQFVYGFCTATEVAYYSYIYAVVDTEHYRKVAGYTRGAILMGKFSADVVGQLLVSFDVTDLYSLNFISLASVSLSLIAALCLPPVQQSAYFHPGYRNAKALRTFESVRIKKDIGIDNPSYDVSLDPMPEESGTSSERMESDPEQRQENLSYCQKAKHVVLMLWRDFRMTYTKRILLAWSIWWAIASCGNFQVGNYIQSLWKHIAPHRANRKKYNGGISAASTLLGAISSFSVGLIPANWTAYGELLLGTIALLNCLLLFVMAYTTNIWVAYCLYVVFRAAYQMAITVVTFQIARYMEAQRFGLVFGFNMFVALLLETILTAVVVDKRGLNVSITTQFAVNGGYFGAMGVVFFVAAVVNLSRRGCVSCRAEDSLSDKPTTASSDQVKT